jgi:myosin V
VCACVCVQVVAGGVQDMCGLNYLHEPAILANLRQRFFDKLPYTFTGEICIAVNPYQWLDIYDDRTSAM